MTENATFPDPPTIEEYEQQIKMHFSETNAIDPSQATMSDKEEKGKDDERLMNIASKMPNEIKKYFTYTSLKILGKGVASDSYVLQGKHQKPNKPNETLMAIKCIHLGKNEQALHRILSGLAQWEQASRYMQFNPLPPPDNCPGCPAVRPSLMRVYHQAATKTHLAIVMDHGGVSLLDAVKHPEDQPKAIETLVQHNVGYLFQAITYLVWAIHKCYSNQHKCYTNPDHVQYLANIKPTNVFLDWDESNDQIIVRLSPPCGLLLKPRDEDDKDEITNHYGFIAPEFWNRKKEITTAFDIFSLGCLLGWMLRGGGNVFVAEDADTGTLTVAREGQQKPTTLALYKHRTFKAAAAIHSISLQSPAARHILLMMLNPEASLRPTATEVLQHFYLWDTMKRDEFIFNIGKSLNNINTTPTHKIHYLLKEVVQEFADELDNPKYRETFFLEPPPDTTKHTSNRRVTRAKRVTNQEQETLATNATDSESNETNNDASKSKQPQPIQRQPTPTDSAIPDDQASSSSSSVGPQHTNSSSSSNTERGDKEDDEDEELDSEEGELLQHRIAYHRTSTINAMERKWSSVMLDRVPGGIATLLQCIGPQIDQLVLGELSPHTPSSFLKWLYKLSSGSRPGTCQTYSPLASIIITKCFPNLLMFCYLVLQETEAHSFVNIDMWPTPDWVPPELVVNPPVVVKKTAKQGASKVAHNHPTPPIPQVHLGGGEH
eukprot:TRINITY_DN2905_c0_g1_i1.p1 TRINITY_DN2905_c0_g1~~TRINITY_DN2905_c0_g1_i1.p1  ORF type:complete len:778 (+),score=92.13 TRINITY_DN2905_c0_g1_i1:184-2334(+)